MEKRQQAQTVFHKGIRSMGRQHRKPWRAMVILLLVIFVVMLAPSPCNWGAWGERLAPFYDAMKSVLQPVGHFVTSALLVIVVMRFHVSRPVWAAAAFALIVAMVLATAFEFLQNVLPISFSRTFDLADLAFALVGALTGCLIGGMINGYDQRSST
jgi:VanZ family protein